MHRFIDHCNESKHYHRTSYAYTYAPFRLIVLSIPSYAAVLQAIKSLPKDMVSLCSSPLVTICYDVIWQVDKPMIELLVQANYSSCESHWTIQGSRENGVYKHHPCSRKGKYPFCQKAVSPANVAIHDALIVQQCVKSDGTIQKVELVTVSALSFPVLNESAGA